MKTLFEHPGTLSAALLSGCKNYTRIEPLPGTAARALDWGAQLALAGDPAGCAYAGIRAHYVALEPNGAQNALPCRILHIVEDVFQTIVTLRPLSASDGGDFSRLRAELPKEKAVQLREGANGNCLYAGRGFDAAAMRKEKACRGYKKMDAPEMHPFVHVIPILKALLPAGNRTVPH